MKLSQFKNYLDKDSNVNFIQPNGTLIPGHFHITEAGLTTRNFIDCGGTVRSEKTLNLQVWVAQDTNHKLEPSKLKKILSTSENLFGNEDLDIEVEYQTETIGRYGIERIGNNYVLVAKHTDCLAKDHCGVPEDKPAISGTSEKSCCTPGGGCC